MITVRQVEKLWHAQAYRRLVADLIACRTEASFGFQEDFVRPCATAALAMVWMDELSQSHVKLFGRMLRTVLSSQEADGGWGDPVVTAICLRALLCCDGQGVAIDRGLAYLANLQKSEGIWPKEPIRRLDADAMASAFILLELGAFENFQRAVRFGDAVRWFQQNVGGLEPAVRDLWERIARRCHVERREQQALVWS